jgi:23S rRNA (adenine2503-C2)-methyltransferase
MNVLGMTCDQLTDLFQRRYNKGAFHASALYRAFFRHSDPDMATLEAFSASPVLRRQVEADLSVHLPAVVDTVQRDGVTKWILALFDGARVETVVIPMANHATVCISSQVGCRMGCRFCETGQMGWRRNLTADEIVAQVYLVKVRMGIDVRNVVFMGMGEPLDNWNEVMQAIRVLSDQRGLDIARRRMTLSTVGLVEKIRALAAEQGPQLKLAVSLNAPDDVLRTRLMPVNRCLNLTALRNVLADYPLARGNALLIEYVLIKGINDRPEHAVQLARYLRGLTVKLNLIPYNPRRRSPFEAPDGKDVERFHRQLIDQGVFVRLRRSKGHRIRAACGQLGGGAGIGFPDRP